MKNVRTWALSLSICCFVSLVALASVAPRASAQVGFPFPGPGRAAVGGGGGKTLAFVNSESSAAGCTSPCTYSRSGSHYTVVTGYAHVFAFAGAAGLTVSSMTICGVAATSNIASGVTNTPGSWYTAAVTGSSTCDVVVTYSGNPNRSGVSMYNSTGLSSTTASSTGNNASCAAFPTACTVTSPTTAVAGGFTLAGGVNQNCTSNSWSVPTTRDFFINVGAGAICASTASSSGNAGGSHSPSYTDSSGSAGGIAAMEF